MEPVTGSSSIPFEGAKNLDTKSYSLDEDFDVTIAPNSVISFNAPKSGLRFLTTFSDSTSII